MLAQLLVQLFIECFCHTWRCSVGISIGEEGISIGEEGASIGEEGASIGEKETSDRVDGETPMAPCTAIADCSAEAAHSCSGEMEVDQSIPPCDAKPNDNGGIVQSASPASANLLGGQDASILNQGDECASTKRRADYRQLLGSTDSDSVCEPNEGKGQLSPCRAQTRVISPNFKLTFRDRLLASASNSESGAKMIIGDLGSKSLSTKQASQAMTPAPKVAPKRRVRYKYPNIEMPVVPFHYPLLDHDYCYENYCNIVLAATQLLNRIHQQKAKELVDKSKASNSATAASGDDKPARRKYRTKRVIAEERAAERKAALQLCAENGDSDAKDKLVAIEEEERHQRQLEAEKKAKRKYKKRSSVDVNATDEVCTQAVEL